MKKVKWLLMAVVSMTVLFILPNTSFAADGTQKLPFSMEAVIPDNQRSGSTATYFDLAVKPDTEQELAINFRNLSQEELDLKLSANSAITNENGVIDYGQTQVKKDSTAKYMLSDLVTIPKEIKLAVGEVKTVKATLKVPKEKFDGIVLGGIQAQVANKDTSDKSESGLKITSNYALVLGVVLNENPEQTVEPELKLLNVTPGLSNGYTAVLATLQNIKPQMVGQMTITGEVTQKGSQDVLKKTVRKNQEMAPNSSFNFPISWENEALAAGDYTLKLVAQNEKHKWEFSQDFTISGEQEQTLNKKAVGIKKDYTWLWILLGVLLFVVLLVLAFLLGKRRRKDDEEEK